MSYCVIVTIYVLNHSVKNWLDLILVVVLFRVFPFIFRDYVLNYSSFYQIRVVEIHLEILGKMFEDLRVIFVRDIFFTVVHFCVRIN